MSQRMTEGAHVKVTGSYVVDHDPGQGWREIHPITFVGNVSDLVGVLGNPPFHAHKGSTFPLSLPKFRYERGNPRLQDLQGQTFFRIEKVI